MSYVVYIYVLTGVKGIYLNIYGLIVRSFLRDTHSGYTCTSENKKVGIAKLLAKEKCTKHLK